MAEGGGGDARTRTRIRRTDERARFPTIQAIGDRLRFHEDLYHLALRISWKAFFLLLTAAFATLNVIFASLYMVVPGSVGNATSFADHFFFSVETLATIGYGEMTPQNRWAHGVVVIEALVGILSTAMVTGLFFVRVARPTARILFSDKMVICTRDGVPHLMFRMANWRRNQIGEAQLNVMLLMTETTREGETLRRPERLPLVRETNPVFALSWTAMHRIDEKSPLFGEGLARLRAQKVELFLSLTGLDETLMQTISARWRYSIDDIVEGHRFADIIVVREDGTRVIDYDKFHELIPITPSTTAETSA